MDAGTKALQNLTIHEAPVYLLKTPSLPSDTYEEALLLSGTVPLKPIFVPVLEHLFRDDALRALKRHAERFAFAAGSSATARQKATNNPSKKYSGIIFTSQRAIDAFRNVVTRLDSQRLGHLFDSQIPLYVVGPATARGANALGLPCPVLGADSGNGEALSHFIIKHHSSLPREVTHLHDRKLPLLFLVGEQRRDIIPTLLQSTDLPETDRIHVQEVVVYETGEMATFEEDITSQLGAAQAKRCADQFIVIFSPQGSEATLNALGWLNTKTGKYDEAQRRDASEGVQTFVVTIGPTTCEYLETTFGFRPDAVARQPTPTGVLEAIQSLKSRAA